MVVAIDGPAGCGKSTVAKILAERLHLTFLNSGSFYRGRTSGICRMGHEKRKNIESYLG